MQQKVILIGPGNVGRTFLKQVLENDSISVGKHYNPTVIMGVVAPNEFLFHANGLSDDEIRDIIDTQTLGNKAQKIASLSEVLDTVMTAGLNGEVIFVDASSGKDELKDFHLQIIEESDNYIVTANKNPVSLFNGEVYKRLTKNQRYQYTTTVMAGSGIVRFLRGTRKISDTIHRITGMFSGTLGYISSELETGKKISDIVREAYNLRYTEPNPWDDLNGVDVARKLIILARSAGFKVEMSDIKIEPMLPPYLASCTSTEELLQTITKEDDAMSLRIQKLAEEGKVLRYLASLENDNEHITLKVGLQEVLKDSPFGRLSGPANFVEVVTDLYHEGASYMLQSPGAGLEVTAGSLRKDMLSFLPRLEHVQVKTGKSK